MNYELGLQNKKRKRATYLKRGSQQPKAKINFKKINARLTKKISRITPASVVLSYPKRCVFSAQIARCGHGENALMAVPTVFA